MIDCSLTLRCLADRRSALVNVRLETSTLPRSLDSVPPFQPLVVLTERFRLAVTLPEFENDVAFTLVVPVTLLSVPVLLVAVASTLRSPALERTTPSLVRAAERTQTSRSASIVPPAPLVMLAVSAESAPPALIVFVFSN